MYENLPTGCRLRKLRCAASNSSSLSDLVEAKYPADDLLEAYLQRWGIEQTFLQVSKMHPWQHLIGSMPQATVLHVAFCFLLFNNS